METLTTGDIARYLDVNQRTVLRWLNCGRLKGFKLPGRGNNRVLVSDFISFLNENSMPVPENLQKNLQKDSQQHPQHNQQQSQPDTRPRVMLVDDEPAVLQAVKRSLKPLDLNLITAGNGFQAGFELVRFNPQLIVLDLSMPGIDGFAVIRYIREEFSDLNVCILILSALAEEQLQRAIDLGADAVLGKPFTNCEINQAVTGLLGLDTA